MIAAYGLDQPVAARYLSWLGGVLTGDLGQSLTTQESVASLLGERLPISLEIAGLAVLLALVIAIPLGVFSAYRPGGLLDRAATLAVSVTLSVPTFLLGVLLLFVVSVRLGLLPVNGWVDFSRDPVRHLQHLILPVVTLAAAEAVLFIRLLRNDMVAVLQEDFVLSARTRGLSTPRILFGHALRPASFSMLPVLSYTMIVAATLIVAEGSLSFLGLGIPPPAPSWGGMIAAGRAQLEDNVHFILVPAAFFFLTVFSLNRVGDWARGRFGKGASL